MPVDVLLFDSSDSVPEVPTDRVRVVTAPDDKGTPATQIHVTYTVGRQSVHFRKNCNSSETRFEEALKWAVGYAVAHGIPTVHAVFELDRPIDPFLLARFFPNGRGDRREKRPGNLATRRPPKADPLAMPTPIRGAKQLRTPPSSRAATTH